MKEDVVPSNSGVGEPFTLPQNVRFSLEYIGFCCPVLMCIKVIELFIFFMLMFFLWYKRLMQKTD